MKYSIVIATYNHCDDLLKPCVESIVKYTNLEDIELIIVANGCTDETQEYLQYLDSYFSRTTVGSFKYLFFQEPLGYAKANNKGLEVATCDKIVLLNNDIVLLEQVKNTWITLLDSQFKNTECGVSCALKIYSEAANHDFAVFFCVMIHRKVFDTIGVLNEEYGAGGCEDIEFCIKAEKAGFKVCQATTMQWSEEENLHVGSFPLYHKGEGTVHDKSLVPDWSNIFYNNNVKIAKKYNPTWVGIHNKNTQDYKSALSFLKRPGTYFYEDIVINDEYNVVSDKNIVGRNILDIGANIGTFSLLTSYLGAKKVVSVEPTSNVYAQLIDNINTSKLHNIVPLKNIVSNISNEVFKISVNDFSGVNSMYNVGDRHEEVRSITLSELLTHFDDDDIYLKIDCEGAEYDILLNASEEDMRRITQISIEIHMDLHPTYKGAEILENKLRGFGFNQTGDHQLLHWDFDSAGNKINMKKLPCKLERWSK